MSPAEAWLREHLAEAPARLLDAMIAAVATNESASVADALAEGAIALYQRVLAGTGRREDALPLLAADALMTHALEAQAASDPSGIAVFTERWGAAGRLGELAANG
ncbi:MAG TPA: hypothetical protein VFH27_03720 [Longimicrobiaceae bacterium]|nr:hypothetical protein [Longimicrobiaceae bacterium]